MTRDRSRFVVSEARVGRVLVAFVALGFVALLAGALAIAWITQRNRGYTESVIHTQDVRQAIGEMQIVLEQSETARRGYLLTGDPFFRGIYDTNVAEFPMRLTRLRRLTHDNRSQQARIERVAGGLDRLRALRWRSVAQVSDGDIAGAQRAFSRDGSVPVMRAIRVRLRATTAAEAALLASRSTQQASAQTLFTIALGLTALLLGVVAILSLLVVSRSTRALAEGRDQLRDLNETLEDAVVERTADLTRANEEIQRFAYIVSHDLRSPLVNVMGFTAELESAAGTLRGLVDRVEARAPDLVDDDAKLAAREDLPEAIGFIRTSTQKMDRLINAILTLARQGRRILSPEPLDLAGIVTGIHDSLAHRLADEGAEIVVEATLPPLTSDRLATEQILSNLIENAIKYRHPDRAVRVVVGGRTEGPRTIVEVADNGRGIATRDHARVFDLFRRSGAQTQPGEGIGLAHVRALAYRLGGTIGLSSVLGEGSTFRLNLPTTLMPQQDDRS